MKRIATLLTIIMLSLPGFAIPARPGQWHVKTLADGTSLRVQLVGDEFLHYWQAADGRRFSEVDGRLEQADMEVLRTHAVRARGSIDRRRQQRARQSIGNTDGLYTGSRRGIVVLAEFPDLKFQEGHDKAFYQGVVNGLDYTNDEGSRGSVRDYFLEQSGGRLDLQFDVVGPVQLSHQASYYGGDKVSAIDVNSEEMIRECAIAAGREVNFADYDWDGDGVAEELFIVYAGKGQADGGGSDAIWPKMFVINDLKVGGTVISVYACGSELRGDDTFSGIGTICHEYSHCMGLPDLYDTGYGGNFGMGPWDLMASGSYNGGGHRPSGYSGICKMLAGWLQPTLLEDATAVIGQQPLSQGGEVFMIPNDAYTDEFLLLENRQQVGFDDGQRGHGLLFVYVDYNKTAWEINNVNNASYTTHQQCTIIHADNSHGTTDDDLSGDPFPYGPLDSLTVNSVVRPTLYHANSEGDKVFYMAVTDIREAADGTLSFHYRYARPAMIDADNALFHETFDQCSGVGGNDGKWSGPIAKGQFLPDNEGWDYDGGQATGGNKCARFGTQYDAGVAITPAIPINGTCQLYFRAAPWGADGELLTLSVEGDAQLADTEFMLTKAAWSGYTTTLNGTGPVRIRFTGVHRFFIDEVVVKPSSSSPGGATAVEHTCATADQLPPAPEGVFTLSGQRMADGHSATLPPGIYIIDGKKTMRQ